MWNYEKRLEYPIKIKQTNPTLAAMIISQYGGPDGELGASMRYISQRYSMPYREVSGLLTDIGVSVVKLHILDLSRCSGSFSFRSLKIFQ
jgi:Mn-containing catalase